MLVDISPAAVLLASGLTRCGASALLLLLLLMLLPVSVDIDIDIDVDGGAPPSIE
jgi:hypothetical protein